MDETAKVPAAVQVEPMEVTGAWSILSPLHRDARGVFHEIHVASTLSERTGLSFVPRQTNVSTSRRGALRGVAYTVGSPVQAKFVTCLTGSVIDVAVDLRVGSPTFGQSQMHRLGEDTGRSVLLSAGIGHCFLALTDQATVLYLLSEPHVPGRERAVDALDPELGISWPRDMRLIRSARDITAPSVREARDAGLLPRQLP